MPGPARSPNLLVDQPAIARRDLGVVSVSGPDRLTYLHTLLSQHLEGAAPGTAADFLYLDAKGTALAAGRALVRNDDVWLVVPGAVAADLAASLEKYKFLLQVEAIDRSDRTRVASVRGPGPFDVPGAPADPMTFAEVGQGAVLRDRSGGIDLVGPPNWVEEQVASLQLPTARPADFEAWRITAGEPGWGTEIAPGRRAQELGLLPTHVHLRKGCYPGQESIAKIYNLGRPRRALMVLEVEGPATPGDVVTAGEKAGEVTSAAPAQGRSLALALVPLGPDGKTDDRLTVAGAPARVVRRVGEGLAQPGV